MKVVIIGAGEVGSNLARYLSASDEEVVVIEACPEQCLALDEKMDVVTIQGSGADPSVLRSAGLDNADLLVAVTDSDETNLMAVYVAGQYLPDRAVKMARVRSPSYFCDPEMQKRFGVDVVINPEAVLADKVLKLLELPGSRDVLQFEQGRVVVSAFKAHAEGPLVGKQLKDLRHQDGHADFVVGAILRRREASQARESVIIPWGSDEIQKDDLVYFVTHRDATADLSRWLRPQIPPTRSILIGGSGDLAIHLAARLSHTGYLVRLMLPDPEVAQAAAELLDKAIVLNQDASELANLATLLDEGVDTFIGASDQEMTNVLTAQVASKLGVQRTFVVTRRFEFMRLIKAVHPGVVLNPFELAAAGVMKRLHQVNVVEVNLFAGEDAEAFEIQIPKGSPLIGTQLKDARLPRGALVTLIVRDGEVIIPRGADTIDSGDRVIMFCHKGVIRKVERMVDPKLKR